MKSTTDEEATSSVNVKEIHHYHNNSSWANRLFDALTLITIGIVFLFNTTGVVSWKIWLELFRFWPLILVSAGISLIFSFSNAGRFIGKALGFLIFLLMLFLAGVNTITGNTFFEGVRNSFPDFFNQSYFMNYSQGNVYSKETTYSKSDFPLIENLTLNLKVARGELKLQDFVSDNAILNAKSKYSNLDEEYSISNIISNNSDMTVNFDSRNSNTSFMMFNNSNPYYEMNLSDKIKKTDVNIQLAAGKAVLDFSKVSMDKVIVETSAGQMDINFTSDALPNLIEIKLAAGETNLNLPNEVGYKINYNVAVGDFKINNKTQGAGLASKGSLISDNYSNANKKTEINVDVAAGSFNLSYK